MDPKELAGAISRRPFTPFRLTLTEGSTYDVRHPEFCMVGRRSVILGLCRSTKTKSTFPIIR